MSNASNESRRTTPQLGSSLETHYLQGKMADVHAPWRVFTNLDSDCHAPDPGSHRLKIDSHGTLVSLTGVVIERKDGFG